MTGHTGNITMEELGRRRFERLNACIQESVDRIMKEKEGKGPFSLTIYSRGEEIIHSTEVKQIHGGDWAWSRDNSLSEKLTKIDEVRFLFESQNDSRTYEETINLDEVTDATGSDAPPTKETRKPQVAGATD